MVSFVITVSGNCKNIESFAKISIGSMVLEENMLSVEIQKSSTLSNKEMAKKISHFLNKCYDSGIFNGTAIVSKNNNILFKGAFGYADVLKRIPMNTKTKFDIGSLTKSFTAMGILILSEQGKLSLDDKLSKYFTEFPEYADHITLHNLLSHQSGIKDYSNDLAMLVENINEEMIIERLSMEELLFEPGTKSSYSNSGYFLLARIIEKASGLSFREFMKQNIFSPLKMNESDVKDKMEITIQDQAVGRNFVSSNEIRQFITGPGGVYTTVGDLYRWHLELTNQKVLPKRAVDKAITTAKLSDGSITRYGYGWRIIGDSNNPTIEHGGASPEGFMSYFIQPISGEYSIILLYNYFYPPNFETVISGIKAIMKGSEPQPDKTPALFKLNKYIIDHGVKNLNSEYRKINSDTINFISFEELDFIQLSSFYKNRNQPEKALAILDIYKKEYPNSLIVYDEILEIYKISGNAEMYKKTDSERAILALKLSKEKIVGIEFTNPDTEESQFVLNVRSGPGSEYGIAYGIKPGEHYTIVGRSLDGEWLKLKNEGWLYNRVGRLTNEQLKSLPFVKYNSDK